MSRERETTGLPVVLTEGFRVFFLSAGLFGAFAIIVWLGWLGVHAAGAALSYVPFSPPPHQWHAHEMVFGFSVAALAGFFLTAVPNWTGAPPSRAVFVIGLAAFWLLGRVAMFVSSSLPPLVVMFADIVFLPLLGLNVLLNLLKSPKPQNMLFLILLAMLTTANVLVHLEWVGLTDETAQSGIRMGLLSLAAMISILGGRVTPGFTRNALMRQGLETVLPRSSAVCDLAGIGSAILLAVLIPFDVSTLILGGIALIASVCNALRLSGWRTSAILDQPILWSLHLGFAMLAAGYAALALAWFGLVLGEAAALHVVGIGAIGGMTLAVMSRAALGHTGRPLVVTRPIAAAYILIALAALVRSAGLAIAPELYFTVMFVSGGLWVVAFVVFVAVYAPIVAAPRMERAQ